MRRQGFALLEILIVVAIIALLFCGGWYLRGLGNQVNMVQTGVDAEDAARQGIQKMNAAGGRVQDMINQVASSTGK